MTRNPSNTPLPEKPVQRAKAKSQHRREELTALATASSTPRLMRNDLVPKLALIECAPADLVISARNVRKVKPAHLREVAAAIRSLGFCDPVLIDGRNTVLDGVVRVEAAKLLGLTHIACIRADHLTGAERRLVRIALNRLSEKGSWNFETLKLELKELILEDAPIEITGFSVPEIDHIIIGEKPAALEAGPLGPDPDAKPIVQVGDIFALGEHQIICGDSTDPSVLEVLMFDDEDEARLILTDEPYNVSCAGHVTSGDHREVSVGSGEMNDAEFRAFNTAWIGACLTYLCDGGLFATFIDWQGYPAVVAAALQLGLAPFDLIVWAKPNGGMGSLYRSQHELLPLFKKGKAPHINNVERGNKRRWRSNVWSYPGARLGSEARDGLQHHPTVKPVAMLEDALLDMTERGDIVIDPFLGSGSTLIACEKTGRRCRGVEVDPLYVEVVLRRYEAMTT
jgi:DNA modification methylase